MPSPARAPSMPCNSAVFFLLVLGLIGVSSVQCVTFGGRPPPESSRAGGAREDSGARHTPEGRGTHVSAADTASNDGVPIPKTVLEPDPISGAATSSMVGEATAGGPVATTGPSVGASLGAETVSPGDDDNAVEEAEVVMGHPSVTPWCYCSPLLQTSPRPTRSMPKGRPCARA
jgi:hypothetical protein